MDQKFCTIKSLNISEQKGTIKTPRKEIVLTPEGIEGDAHAGRWHRQVSLLAAESIKRFESELGRKIEFGEFAENITTFGFEVHKTLPFDRFVSGDVVLEVTQIGKKCHGTNCEIFQLTGNCVMPTEGIFCRVIQPGKLQENETLNYIPKTFRIKVITLSDRAYEGIYKDKSGPLIEKLTKDWLASKGYLCETDRTVIPDEPDWLESELQTAIEQGFDIIYTTGSTGIGPRDIAPKIISSFIDLEIPGIMDMIRLKYGTEKPSALLSRSIAGVKDKTLVFSLPGSTKAVNEYLSEIHKILMHSFLMLHSIDSH
ncbi:molybdenum cofactor synthesis protein [Maribellus sp. CM-23]|uniref:MOSC domain-containing protein n=1 Tax=Maribellus sp. CM-23 TaxID=2781026 RepID=UPI001F23E1B5|nr:MOSC domain-containing protein [Maribellus sp. CM-23]MCE4564315.1 molybdenum cofactor synthesis protein [Maribellus sp. CM-23]